MKKVLLVENSRTAQFALVKHLEEAGYEVDSVRFGQDAVDTITGAPDDYGFVIMDIYMPRMNGHEAAKKIREAGIETPIVAYTASTDSRDEKMCMECGMNGFVQKSDDHAELGVALKQHIG